MKDNLRIIQYNKVIEKYEHTSSNEELYDKSEIIPEKYMNKFTISPDGDLLYIGNDVNEAKTAEEYGVKQDNLLSKIKDLNNLAVKYKQENAISDTATQLCLQYIRRNKYNSDTWTLAAGAVNTGFVDYVAENNTELSSYSFEKAKLIDAKVDFIHMCATLNSYVNTASTLPPEYSGWAGDLASLIGQLIDKDTTPEAEDDGTLATYAKELLGTENENSTFGLSDMLADIDAVNLYNIGVDSFYEAILKYYYVDNTSIQTRKEMFKENFEKRFGTRDIGDTIIVELNKNYVSVLLKPEQRKTYWEYEEKYRIIAAVAFHYYFYP